MKRLYLKRGRISLLVKLSSETNGNRQEKKCISVFEDVETHDPKLLFRITEGGFKNNKFELGNGIAELDAYLILSAAEIIDDFEHYYNNLNQ